MDYGSCKIKPQSNITLIRDQIEIVVVKLDESNIVLTCIGLYMIGKSKNVGKNIKRNCFKIA